MSKYFKKLLIISFMSLIVSVIVLPLLYVFINSFRVNTDYLQHSFTISFTGFTFENYLFFFRNFQFFDKFFNTFLLTAVSLCILVPLSSFGAFLVSSFGFRQRKLVVFFFLACEFLPEIAIIGRIYHFFARIDMINQPVVVILLFVIYELPSSCLICYVFLSNLPKSVLQASSMDGASFLQQFIYVILPMSKQCLLVCAVNSFVEYWNAYMIPQVFLQKDDLQTLVPSLEMLVSLNYFNYTYHMAGVVLLLIPNLVFLGVSVRAMQTDYFD